MRCRPMAVTIIAIIMAKTKRKDLLLDLFQSKLMIIPHAKEFLCLLICGSRYVNRTVVMLSQAFRNNLSITFICLNTLSAALLQHGSWSEYNTLHMLRHKLMIEGVAEATSLITAYKFSIVSVNGTKKLQIFQNLFVIGFCFLVVRSFLIFNCH